MEESKEKILKEFDVVVPQLLCNAVLEVTDGGIQLKPNQFLSYQDEPVGEYESIKSSFSQALDQHLTAYKEELIKKVEGNFKDEHPVEDGVPVETYGYEETHNLALKVAVALIKEN